MDYDPLSLSGLRGIGPYVNEVCDLAGSLLRHLDELERLSKAWQKESREADEQAAKAPNGDADVLREAVASQVKHQDILFTTLEAFLASFARLSLLFFPLIREKSPDAAFKKARSERLQSIFGVKEDSALADRELRNAWMHFDERLDHAIATKTMGDRQRFVSSDRAKDYVTSTLRLLAVDTLTVYFRTREGSVESRALPTLRDVLTSVFERAALHDGSADR